MTTNGSLTWHEICFLKREKRDKAIPDAWKVPYVSSRGDKSILKIPENGILSAEEVRITTQYDAVGIVEAIRENIFTAEAVTTAFCKRAAIAQQLTNCLSEIFFEEAIETARALDQARLENPDRPLGPFFGLPISLKDSFCLLGKDSTIGMTCFVDKPAQHNSCLVTILRSLDAVLYCKTNVPQTMMTADSDNNVFGRTLNPNNTSLTAGGSTGGEGALIALRGSLLGVGTDIAGSIRIPSSANGVYGFKPSSQIIPYAGQRSPSAPGTVGIVPSAGPMATSIRSCHYFLKTIIEADPSMIDASVLRIPWVTTQLLDPKSRPLRFGLLADDTLHTPSPPMRRGLQETVKKLEAAGHVIVPITIPSVSENLKIIWDLYSLDGSKFTLDLIHKTGEPLVPSVVKTGLMDATPKTLEAYFELNYKRNLAIASFNALWLANDLDAIVTLPAPHTAVPWDAWDVITYTALWNMLDCPAVVIPVGRVDSNDVKDEDLKFASDGGEDKRVYDLYTGPDDFKNAPISIQLVGRKQRDQELADISVLVDDILQARAS